MEIEELKTNSVVFIAILLAVCLCCSCSNDGEPTHQGTVIDDETTQPSITPSITPSIAPSVDSHVPVETPTTPEPVLYSPPIAFLIDSETTPEIMFGQTWEQGGYAICDFCIMPDNSLLILDSRSGQIFRFGDGALIKVYDFDLSPDYLPHKIACDASGNIYLAAAKYNFLLKIDTGDEIHFSKLEGFDLAAMQAFSARNDSHVLLSFPNIAADAPDTLTVDISGETAVVVKTDTGFLTSEFIFIPRHVVDDGDTERMVGHRWSLEVYDFYFGNPIEIIVTSEHWILGGTCHGISEGKYIVELIEVDDSGKFFNYLALIDNAGRIIDRYDIPMGGTLKSCNDTLYFFSQTDTEISISEAFSRLTPIDAETRA